MLGLKHELEVWFFLSLGLLSSSVTLGIAWLRARERAIRAESRLEGLHGLSRPAAMEYGPTLDALAVEMERIGEGQRYLTKVLVDERSRSALPAARPGGASITPH